METNIKYYFFAWIYFSTQCFTLSMQDRFFASGVLTQNIALLLSLAAEEGISYIGLGQYLHCN